MEKRILFVDYETDGLDPNDNNFGYILSVSAIKTLVHIDKSKQEFYIKELSRYNRFYYPESGLYNPKAIAKNNLTKENITKLRGPNCTYPLYYRQDEKTFEDFCECIEFYCGHNIEFDSKWPSFKWNYTFCTMLNTMYVLNLPSPSFKRNEPKWPSLSEAAEFFKVDYDKSKLHESESDTYLCMKVFEGLLKRPKEREKIINFLNQSF